MAESTLQPQKVISLSPYSPYQFTIIYISSPQRVSARALETGALWVHLICDWRPKSRTRKQYKMFLKKPAPIQKSIFLSSKWNIRRSDSLREESKMPLKVRFKGSQNLAHQQKTKTTPLCTLPLIYKICQHQWISWNKGSNPLLKNRQNTTRVRRQADRIATVKNGIFSVHQKLAKMKAVTKKTSPTASRGGGVTYHPVVEPHWILDPQSVRTKRNDKENERKERKEKEKKEKRKRKTTKTPPWQRKNEDSRTWVTSTTETDDNWSADGGRVSWREEKKKKRKKRKKKRKNLLPSSFPPLSAESVLPQFSFIPCLWSKGSFILYPFPFVFVFVFFSFLCLSFLFLFFFFFFFFLFFFFLLRDPGTRGFLCFCIAALSCSQKMVIDWFLND